MVTGACNPSIGGRGRQILRFHWLDSLPQTASSGSVRDCLKAVRQRVIGNGTQCSALAFLCARWDMYTVHIHTHSCTCTTYNMHHWDNVNSKRDSWYWTLNTHIHTRTRTQNHIHMHIHTHIPHMHTTSDWGSTWRLSEEPWLLRTLKHPGNAPEGPGRAFSLQMGSVFSPRASIFITWDKQWWLYVGTAWLLAVLQDTEFLVLFCSPSASLSQSQEASSFLTEIRGHLSWTCWNLGQEPSLLPETVFSKLK